MTKILVFAVSIIWLSLSGKSVSNEQQKDITVINIDFQYNFKNDTADIKVNNVLIGHHMVLNSGYVGFTDISLKITRRYKQQYKIEFLNNVKYCHRSDKIKLAVNLNGKESLYFLNPHEGKWVGLGKGDGNTLDLTQQKRPFVYE